MFNETVLLKITIITVSVMDKQDYINDLYIGIDQ